MQWTPTDCSVISLNCNIGSALDYCDGVRVSELDESENYKHLNKNNIVDINKAS